jgi:hypothetical protein
VVLVLVQPVEQLGELGAVKRQSNGTAVCW